MLEKKDSQFKRKKKPRKTSLHEAPFFYDNAFSYKGKSVPVDCHKNECVKFHLVQQIRRNRS